MYHHIGAGGVLEQGARAPAVIDLRQRERLGQAGPEWTTRGVLGLEAVGAYEPVAVERLSVAEPDDVQHAVPVEGVVGLQCGVQRVLGVAQIHPVQVGGDLALDGGQVVGAPLGGLRAPRPGAVRMIVVIRQCGQKLADNLDMHQAASPGPITKLTAVAVLPPTLSVPNRRAPST